MQLIETKLYKIKKGIGLFINEYNKPANTMTSNVGKMLVDESIIMYDYKHETFGHVFRIMCKDGGDLDNHFVCVPEGYEEEIIEEYNEK